MYETQYLEKAAKKAIQLLRKQKLEKGQHFMINSDILDTHQYFLEFPNGTIKIVEADSKNCDFRLEIKAVYSLQQTINKMQPSLHNQNTPISRLSNHIKGHVINQTVQLYITTGIA